MRLPDPGPGPIDWARIDRGLCEAYCTTPAAIDRMTVSEIAVLCMERNSRGPAGGKAMTDGEVAEEIRRWKSMTPADRLEDARRKRDG